MDLSNLLEKNRLIIVSGAARAKENIQQSGAMFADIEEFPLSMFPHALSRFCE